MDLIKKYSRQPQSGELTQFQESFETVGSSNTNLIKPILRHWRIILLVLFLICAVGVPAVWYTVKPYYQASGAIRITPVIPNILVGGDEVMPMYKNFKATQAELITSDEVLQRVADNLTEQDPDFFKSFNDTTLLRNRFLQFRAAAPIETLRSALNNGRFMVEPEGDTELIKISMKSTESKTAQRIVNAFMQAYMAVVVSKETDDENQKISILENERKMLLAKLNQQKQDIRELADEYGTDSLTARQEITLQRVGALRSKLTEFETQKITLQVKAQLLEQKQGTTLEPEDMIRLRHEFINADLMVQSLAGSIAQLEQGLVVIKQQLVAGNPEIDRKAKLLDAMKERLETRRQEVSEKFSEIVTREMSLSNRQRLEQVNTELTQISNYEQQLRKLIDEEDAETIKLGHKQLAMEDLQDQYRLTKEMYDTVRRRIQELEMERKRPARISEAYYAQNVMFQDDRKKYTAAVIFGAVVSGLGLAFLVDRFDSSLHTPDDIVKHTTVRVIGTTSNLADMKKSQAPHQIADDYHTICTNLSLFSDGKIPQKLVISSSRSGEGKTTLAVNLATSIAKTGKKVLIIDGDLRKPDLSRLLNIPVGLGKLNDMVQEEDFVKSIYSTRWSGVDVLTARPHESCEIYKLLSQQRMTGVIDRLAEKYDHIIIDTPPIMVFSDALLWAKISGAVLLTSFSGFTTESDLNQSIERMMQIKVNVVGVVLNNVRAYSSYNYYRYGKYANETSVKKRTKTSAKLLLANEENAVN